MRTIRLALATIVLLVSALTAWPQTVSPAEASKHAGERVTVCGQAVSVHYARTSRGQPTFINLDKPYPNQVFTIVVWGSDRGKFGDLNAYEGKKVCASGVVKMFRGTPEIVASDPAQLQAK